MSDWFVISFKQVTSGGFKTVKVSASTEDEAVQLAGLDCSVAFPVQKGKFYERPVHIQIIDENNASRLLEIFDNFLSRTENE